MIVSIDSNVVDLIDNAAATSVHVEAMEGRSLPPRFAQMSSQLEVETFACYWIIALASAWTSTIYTYSAMLHWEIIEANKPWLNRVLSDVLTREEQLPEHRIPNRADRPTAEVVERLGLKRKDAIHVADSVGMGCQFFLTNDGGIVKRSHLIDRKWGMKVRRPSDYLVETVRSRAPWQVGVPWPWESIDRISQGSSIVGLDYSA